MNHNSNKISVVAKYLLQNRLIKRTNLLKKRRKGALLVSFSSG
jgi:hypothetical protein